MEDMMNRIQEVLKDEESMKLLRELAGMLSSHNSDAMPAAPAVRSETDSIDTVKLMQLGQILQTASQDDDHIRLMSALRPLLKEETRVKLDRVIKIYRIMNIYPALKESGLGGGGLFGII
ncbi:hypothetical protein [Ruminococcus albus]|uniref:Uncharacterized protein n=1 Tax=Ruminococcus albus TaxID=1264 RepID=A0A1I1P9Z4_RUMAL|nr:hypothetical protein [Ruminococcus albus]SFD06771.1 hypothetical protein SAMN02910406_03014 [Ruminococcus albus]